MNINLAINQYLSYLKTNTRPNTIRSFGFVLKKFDQSFGNKVIFDIKDQDIIEFINQICIGSKMSTKCGRISVLSSFFNFVIEVNELTLINPCSKPLIRRMFRGSKYGQPNLLEKDIVDEIIFRTTGTRDRLILELMGRSGMRISEVLNIRPCDIDNDSSTLTIKEPKSGRIGEKVYIHKKLCNKLQQYITLNSIKFDNKVFPISYSTIYRMIQKSSSVLNVSLKPHDLRRHAATQASRSNIPLEIVSKVILRHANISTTQRYLGMVNHDEARMYIEQLNR